jgi:RNA polymerase sigma-70 factor (ECF subfamily)
MPDESVDNEKELMKLIADGDEIAFAKLFSHYRNRIYSIAFKLTKSYVIAEEIVQDVFLKIWINRSNLNDIQNFSGYLFIVTRNNAYKVLKGIARDYKIILVTEKDQTLATNDTSDLLMENEYNLVLQNAIGRLPKQQKEVYIFVKEHGLTRDEVANKMQIRPETVKFHLAQAMKKIRAFCMLHIGTFTGFTIFLSHLFRNN